MARGAGGPVLLRLQDAYLEVYGDVGSRAELVETAEIAYQIGKVARAISLRPEGDDGEFADAPLTWLAEILQDSPLGSDIPF